MLLLNMDYSLLLNMDYSVQNLLPLQILDEISKKLLILQNTYFTAKCVIIPFIYSELPNIKHILFINKQQDSASQAFIVMGYLTLRDVCLFLLTLTLKQLQYV